MLKYHTTSANLKIAEVEPGSTNILEDTFSGFTIEPVTKRNWNKFVKLFGDRGACGNCWCMYYRLSNNDFREGKADEGNKMAIKEIIRKGKPAGLIGLFDGEAIAWCAFAPREDFMNSNDPRP